MTPFILICAVMLVAAIAYLAVPLVRSVSSAAKGAPATPRSTAVMVALVIALPVAAAALYSRISNFPWDNPIAAAAVPPGHGEGAAGGDMNEVKAQLEARLAANPGDLEGWQMLGRTYLVTGEAAKAVTAYQKAIDLTGGKDPALKLDLAEALILTENRTGAGVGSAPQPVAGIPPQPPGAAPPPPPPGAPPATAAIAAPASPDAVGQDAVQREATLYLRGMIAAAASDGAIDAEERNRILGQLEKTGLDPQGREFLLAEMDLPATLDELAAAVEGRQQGLRLYISSLLAVEVDTDAERDHLRRLGERLQLPAETLAAIHLRYNVTV